MSLPLIIFVLMFVLTMLRRIPIAYGMIMSSIFYFAFATGPRVPISMAANQFLSNMNVSFILLAVPLFIFAADLMNTGAVTELIFRFANTLVGRWKGGMGHVNVLAALIFSGMTGSAVADASEDNLLLAPIQSSVVPLPHQLYALNRAMSQHRIRYLLADEVGLGKTIEAGLILRELKLRGMARRILVVAPKGLVRQWQAEMRLHFGEKLQHIDPAELAAFRQWRNDEENLWRVHDQVVCSLDSVKPIEGRRGWTLEQLNDYNRERFEDLVSASWDLVIIDEPHRMGGSTYRVARYKLGAALAEAAPYLLLLSATPPQGKTDQFLRLMQLVDRDSFPDEGSLTQDPLSCKGPVHEECRHRSSSRVGPCQPGRGWEARLPGTLEFRLVEGI